MFVRLVGDDVFVLLFFVVIPLSIKNESASCMKNQKNGST